ncbi:MAG: putative DNA binding domain-containing protein, partial [Bacteroidetes bacterium]|nr:putative DNA binding domain-containing protein [Bacteroidota bacterium]
MKNQPNISKLIELGESETLEFKISFGKEVLETVCAFANTKGGIIIIGVSDDVIVQGVETGKETLQNIQNQIKQGIQPNVIPEVYSTENEGKLLIIINVDEFPVKPVSFKGRYFKRINNSNHLLDINEIANLYLKTFNLSWDSYPYPSSSIADIDKEKVYSFIEKVNKEERFSLPSDFESSLLKLKLIKENKPTAAAMLLFATHALNYKIHIGRFKSPTNIIDDKQIEDTLFEANDQALKFILNYIKVSFEFVDGLERIEKYEYPIVAIREALINAIIHRDYSIPGDVQIKIFDNKISIFNPGRLYNLSLDDLKKDNYQSNLRNILVAEAFYLTRRIEKYGSGLIRIRKELEK